MLTAVGRSSQHELHDHLLAYLFLHELCDGLLSAGLFLHELRNDLLPCHPDIALKISIIKI